MTSIVTSTAIQETFRHPVQLSALAEHLGDDEINDICEDLGHTWRERTFPPAITLRSCVHRALHPDHSITAMLADLAAVDALGADVPTDSAWCQARSRLPLALFRELIVRRAHDCRDRFGELHQWNGRSVFIVDGSTVSMPDEPELVETFGYAPTRLGPSRFPVARVTFVELAGTEIIWDYRLENYRASEEAQFEDMWPSLPDGCILLADRKFCSFYMLAKLQQQGVDVVTRLHARRDPKQLIQQGQKLGPNEWLVTLTLWPQLRRKYNDSTLPERLRVRLIRVPCSGNRGTLLWLVTTLRGTRRYPRQDIADGYRWRWDIEGRIGSLKTTLEMNVLRSKTSTSVHREVASTILGHNLVWSEIHEAAQSSGVSAGNISFACAVKIVVAFSLRLALGPPSQRPLLKAKMLRMIASQTNHHPFGRVEPRRIKRDKHRYPYLKEKRDLARKQCLT